MSLIVDKLENSKSFCPFMFCRNEEWESDSSFDFNKESEPVTGLPHFYLVYYKDPEGKKTKFPFEICHIQGRLLYGFYLQEADRGSIFMKTRLCRSKENIFVTELLLNTLLKELSLICRLYAECTLDIVLFFSETFVVSARYILSYEAKLCTFSAGYFQVGCSTFANL